MTDYAHIRPNDWKTQSIQEHCGGTAAFAEEMASVFDAGAWAKLCGLWHDIGKYSPKFQQHIIASSGFDAAVKDPGKVDHASAGALLAKEELKKLYLPISYCICGHHSGLMDYVGDGHTNLQFHLSSQSQHYLDNIRRFIPKNISIPTLPMPNFDRDSRKPKAWHLWIRMLFSCLVDADRLDTERFMKPEDFVSRGHYNTLAQMRTVFDTYLANLEKNAPETKVNVIRAEVQKVCKKAGFLPQGIYSLTVPTGGGKTLSSLLWAMEHARKYGLKRIIIAIPYTSIVTQTADKLREIFGTENVVEHHSYVDPDKMADDSKRKMKLATENWDAPLIVTTNVQLFESLYSNKTSRCRKLHNIIKSVLILDEVQTLPAENLRPIIDILGSLSKYMGTSILFTTATQPAFTGTIGSGLAKFKGLECTEIVHDVDKLFGEMRRVKITFEKESFSYEVLANKVCKQEQILCIVNTRKEAQQLYNALQDKTNAFHLSRTMCQQHISDELKIIKDRLNNNKPVKVVSTQLIEAGVDIDFPVVWRKMAGLDSIAQAAGRCNREGRLEQGEVHVFQIEGSQQLSGIMAKAENAARDLLYAGENDFLSPRVAKDYFRLFYAKLNDTDKSGVTDMLYKPCPDFESAANAFHMIEDDTLTIYVPYSEEGEKLTEKLCNGDYCVQLMRKLQRYSVSVGMHMRDDIERMGALKLSDRMYVLPDCSNYDANMGLVSDNKWLNDDLII